jgi:hypothetical protein
MTRYFLLTLFATAMACQSDQSSETGQANDTDSEMDTDDDTATKPDIDMDEDGYPSKIDCDDDDDRIYPQAGDVYGDGIDSDCDEMDCEAAAYGGIYFAACKADVDRSQAATICENAGYSSLATIVDADEDSFVITLMSEMNDPEDFDDHFWFGLSEGSEGWAWDSGLAVNYWAEWQEDNDGTCARWVPDRGWLWGDSDCSNLYNYVCETR